MTIFGFYISMAVIWLILAVIFLAVEALTVGLTTIWFAAGSFVALLLALLKVATGIQFAVFLVVSCCLLIFTRKIFVEKLKTGSEATGADVLIGQTGEVIKQIGALEMGQVRIRGQVWSAIGKEDAVIDQGQLVKVISIEGVKLIVIPVTEK